MASHTQPVDAIIERTLEIERAVLGGILIDGERYHDAREHVTEADFFRLAHRVIWRGLTRLVDQQKPIDTAMLIQELTPKELEDAEGVPYISRLIDGVPAAMNVAYYAREVQEKASLRALAAAARKTLIAIESGESEPEEILDEAEQSIFAIRDRHTRIDVATPESRRAKAYAQIESVLERGAVRGVTTGLTQLDSELRGLHPGNLIIVAARPSMGKTSLGQKFCIAAGREDEPALYFSLEMSEEELNLREVTTRATVNSWRLLHGAVTPFEQKRLMYGLEEMRQGGTYVVDRANLTVGQIAAIARRFKRRHGLKLVVIDYLQLIVPEHRKGKSTAENRAIELGMMSRALKNLARELHVPVVVMSQLSRAAEARPDRRPQLADLRESGSLEQDADVVLLLYRPNAYKDIRDKGIYKDHYVEIAIAKQRNGPTGTITASYYREFTKFADWSEDPQPLDDQGQLAPADDLLSEGA